MSIHPESDDLDRTDELPQLDVVAYEAAHTPDALSSTDTWMVEALRDSEASTDTIVRGRTARPQGTVDLSINVERLLQRIATLESDLAAATGVREPDTPGRVPNSERSELTGRIAALEAENAHLREQLAISANLTQRLQQQLREQAETHKTLLARMDATREADRFAAEQQRLSLEQQLESSTTTFTSTADEHARLREALEESRELAAARARQIDELQRSLIVEHGKSHVLGRNLAAKLADYDIMSAMVSQRNATIAALERARDELGEQLQQRFADAGKLTTLLEEANQRAAASDQQAAEIASRNERLAQLGAEIEALRQDQSQSAAAREAMTDALREAASHAETQRQREQALSAEINELRAALQSVASERDQLLPLRAELDARSTQLVQVTAELAEVKRDAAAVWSELETQSGFAKARQEELAAARQSIDELQRTRDELQRSRDELQRTQQDLQRKIERLHAVSHDDTQLLNERIAELAATRRELQEQSAALRGLEQSLNARDKLIENLRVEMRTAQDERAIMSEQVAKARAQAKTMAQQIFSRDNRIATLKADLAVHTEALAAIRDDVDRIDSDPAVSAPQPLERLLEPVGHEGEPILLNRRVMTIGRTNDNDIFIPSKMISRHHARLLVGPNAVIVEDAGSTNGCFVNDQPIRQHVLHEADVLSMGGLKFRLSVRPVGAAARPGKVVDLDEGRRLDD